VRAERLKTGGGQESGTLVEAALRSGPVSRREDRPLQPHPAKASIGPAYPENISDILKTHALI
jgi:hypothetical protein